MKSNYFKTKIGGGLLTLSLLVGIGMTSGVTAQAQYQNGRDDQYRREQRDQSRRNQRDDRDRATSDGYPDYGGSFQLRQTALNAGYNKGIKEGRNDRNRGERDVREFDAYQNATSDYNRNLGDRELYRTYFRLAFPTGYNDGLRGY
jgi:hypothetical protein